MQVREAFMTNILTSSAMAIKGLGHQNIEFSIVFEIERHVLTEKDYILFYFFQ